VLSGSRELIKQVISFRNFGAGWSSRILQQALAYLIKDEKTQQGIAHAKAVYAQRRKAMSDALQLRGVHIPHRDGLAMWIPVPSEQFALVTLAARGLRCCPASAVASGRGSSSASAPLS
ncbi:hypothetical protein, partial [Pseudomonas azotoformans]